MTTIKVVQSDTSQDFEKRVNQWLASGWKLHGEPSFTAVPRQYDQYGNGMLRCEVEYSYTQMLIQES